MWQAVGIGMVTVPVPLTSFPSGKYKDYDNVIDNVMYNMIHSDTSHMYVGHFRQPHYSLANFSQPPSVMCVI